MAVLTLVLGIGANSTIFSWINSTLLNPIPGVSDTKGLICLARGGTAFSDMAFSYPDYVDLRAHSRSVFHLTAFTLAPVNLTGTGKPRRVWGTLASASYFDALGIRPLRGRGFLPAEDSGEGGAPVTVISYQLWQTHFGGSESVVGRTVSINFHPYTVVGIAPPSFQGTQTGLRADLWIPLVMANRVLTFKDGLDNRARAWLFLMGRLQPGVESAAAQAEMKILMRRLVDEYPGDHRGQSVSPTAYPVWRSPYGGNRYLYVVLPTLMVASGLLLLLACANMATLLLVRGLARRREIAIQLALGAGRSRLIRRFLVESAIVATVGGALATLVTVWSSGLFSRFVPPSDIPIDFGIQFDRTVLFATLLISVVATLVFGIVPALRVTALSPQAVLKDTAGSVSGGISTSWLSRGLVVLQIALSLILMISTGLFARSFENAQQFDPGFDRKGVLLATFDLASQGYKEEDTVAFQRNLLTKLQSIPGVDSATLSNWTPLGPSAIFKTIGPEGYVPRPEESMVVGVSMVGPQHFKTMRIPIVLGREFTLIDTNKSQLAAIVNQALADRYWPGESALGKRIEVASKAYSVVGVARNSNYHELNEASQPFVYLATLQNYGPQQTLFVRVQGDPLTFASVVEGNVHELNADLALFDVSTLEARVQFASATKRMAATLVGAFGFLALVLASIGIYGVVANTARQRTREIGIRMAIGARRADIARLVLGDGLRLMLIGISSGLVASLVLTRFLRTFLFGVAPTDAWTYVGAVVLLAAVSLMACYVPAHRAMGVEPTVALRSS